MTNYAEEYEYKIAQLEQEGRLHYGDLPERDQGYIKMAIRDDMYFYLLDSGYTILTGDGSLEVVSPTGVEADYRAILDQTLGALWELHWKYKQPARTMEIYA